MNDQRARELFSDHHRGTLSPVDAAALRAYLAAHPEIQREFDELAQTLSALDAMPTPPPSPRLRAGVLAAIAAEKRALQKDAAPAPSVRATPAVPPRSSPWFWLGQAAAACALTAIGFIAGNRNAPPAQPSPSTAIAADPVVQRELADLRRQVDSMSQLMGYPLLREQQRPTSARLSTVLASASLEHPNDRVINELIGSLALDPSTNVRLTALEALYPHAKYDVVRAGVLASLPREQSPLVQVAMIDFLVAAREREATSTLERISSSEAADYSVRDAAKRALTQL